MECDKLEKALITLERDFDNGDTEYFELCKKNYEKMLKHFLEKRVLYLLKEGKLKNIDEVHSIVQECQIDWEGCVKSTQTRLDLEKALVNASSGAELASRLKYSFFPEDLELLCRLHKTKQSLRTVIEEVLVESNFRDKAKMLASEKYGKYRRDIQNYISCRK